jgi:hypothetical protein
LLLGFLGLLAAFLLYAPTMGHRFVFDDVRVLHSPMITHWEMWPKLLSRDYFSLSGEWTYRPLVTLFYMVCVKLGIDTPGLLHLTSNVWHVANVFLVFSLLRRLTEFSRSYAAAAIYAVHPAISEAIESITYNEDLISTTFGLLALLLWTSPRETRRSLRVSIGAAFFLVAELVKESAATFALLFPLTLFALARIHGEAVAACFRRHKREIVGVLISLAIFVGIRFFAFATDGYGSRPGGTFTTSMGTQVVIVRHYLGLLFYPSPLCPDYDNVILPVLSLTDVRLVAATGILALVMTSMVWAWKTGRTLLVWGTAWFFVALAPVSNVVPLNFIAAERYLYLPFVGAVAAVVHLGFSAIERTASSQAPRVKIVVTFLAVFALSLGTLGRHKDWSSNDTLFLKAQTDCPTSRSAVRWAMNLFLSNLNYKAFLDYCHSFVARFGRVNPGAVLFLQSEIVRRFNPSELVPGTFRDAMISALRIIVPGYAPDTSGDNDPVPEILQMRDGVEAWQPR